MFVLRSLSFQPREQVAGKSANPQKKTHTKQGMEGKVFEKGLYSWCRREGKVYRVAEALVVSFPAPTCQMAFCLVAPVLLVTGARLLARTIILKEYRENEKKFLSKKIRKLNFTPARRFPIQHPKSLI